MYVPTFQGLTPGDFMGFGGLRQDRFPFDVPHQSFYRARNAIYYLFRALLKDNPALSVLMPDYNSGNEVLALQAAGATIHYHSVGPDGQVDPAEIERLCDAHHPHVLYVIHYLGWPQPVEALSQICRARGMWMVEDCALALLSDAGDRPLGSFGHWSIFCLYKTLPLPNGACLVQNNVQDDFHSDDRSRRPLDALTLRQAGLPSVLGRTADLMVRHLRSRADGFGAAMESMKRAAGRAASAMEVPRAKVGDLGFNLDEVDLAMSEISERLLAHLNFEDIRRRRIENYQSLSAALGNGVTRLHADLPEGVCPLFFPILVDNKHDSAETLRSAGVDALEFWNQGAGLAEEAPATQFLRDHVLGIPIHQDLTTRHIDYVAQQVANLGHHRAH